jgi:hypothetical protein
VIWQREPPETCPQAARRSKACECLPALRTVWDWGATWARFGRSPGKADIDPNQRRNALSAFEVFAKKSAAGTRLLTFPLSPCGRGWRVRASARPSRERGWAKPLAELVIALATSKRTRWLVDSLRGEVEIRLRHTAEMR